jgi:hypothetical protein
MANDGGLMAVLEQWMADTLAALQDGGADVFKTADIWRHQLAGTGGGLEASSRYAPFAFISYQGAKSAREGDNDLRQIFEFAVLIGAESAIDGIARFGDGAHLGTSKIRDLIIALFDKKRPDDAEITCDEFYYIDEIEILDMPRKHWVQLNFEVSQLT